MALAVRRFVGSLLANSSRTVQSASCTRVRFASTLIEDEDFKLRYLDGEQEGVAAAECPQACTADYTPVCGNDGETYSNQCELNVKKCESDTSLAVLFTGECECRQNVACTREYDPHCGTDGKTYSNRCGFASAKLCSDDLKLENHGECKSATGVARAECPQMCTADHNPVCGNDAKTYSNLCALNVKQCEGGECECRQNVACTREHDPHCGTDGKTYSNRCAFASAKLCSDVLMLENYGECGSTAGAAECPQACTRDYNPVCGNDGKTYSNQCALNSKRCEGDRLLATLFSAECECRQNVACTMEYNPHCGTDGKTYGNRCAFASAKLCSDDLKLEKYGDCGSAAGAVKPLAFILVTAALAALTITY